ncbi:phage tail tube protein [Streptomyces sp. NPDC001118]|uniref:phage tail tube protein n=1 Tax=Streptomyces sp. NPDC001127 TaxID=3154377 RepID=UPI003327BF16
MTASNVDTSKIRFAPNGFIYMAPSVGATLPTDVGDGKTAPTGYASLGYVTQAGVTITPQINTNPINVWQSAVPVLYNVDSATFSIQATFTESNIHTTELFFGASWVNVKDGTGNPTSTYKLDLASTPSLQEISLVVDWSQGAVLNRVVIPRAMVQNRGAITLVRTAAQEYQLTIEALDSNGILGTVFTNQAMA